MDDLRVVKAEDLDRLEPGAVLVDVREPGEFASQRLPGSVNLPLSRLDEEAARLPKDKPLVVLCRGGQRSAKAAQRLAALGFSDVRMLEGGLLACGSRVENGEGGVWAMERQVRCAAGLLVLAGAALGWLVRPEYFLLSAGVGAGLVFSAVTDSCAMARVLALLPWNARR